MRHLITLLFLIQSSSVLICQNIITVCALEDSPSQYHNLQDAVDAALSGDIIHVLPSPQSLTGAIVDKPLTIYGPGHAPSVESGLIAHIELIELSNASGILIEGLVLTQVALSSGSYSSDVTVRRNRFIGNGRFINTQESSGIEGTNNWTIEGNVFTPDTPPTSTPLLGFSSRDTSIIFRNNYVDCFYVSQAFIEGRPKESVFSNNIIYLRSGQSLTNNGGDFLFHSNIIYIDAGAVDFGTHCPDCDFQANLFFSNTNVLVDPEEFNSTNIINEEPLFEYLVDGLIQWNIENNYSLNILSPGVEAGLDGQDIGIHGAFFNFNMEGRPVGVPIVTVFNKEYDIIPENTPLLIDLEIEIAE